MKIKYSKKLKISELRDREKFQLFQYIKSLITSDDMRLFYELYREHQPKKIKLIPKWEMDFTFEVKAKKEIFHHYRFWWETPNDPGWYEYEEISSENLEREIKNSLSGDSYILDIEIELFFTKNPPRVRTRKEYVSFTRNRTNFPFSIDGQKFLALNPFEIL